ncbi:cytochrome b-c1 complex subunit 2, mitochondrial [Lingula anatina]|uniref:Cytochrome b-c1 complex subunit 2, mitochondrial n=1 Tax=Lingula anatina TaxID=7574 RepID=A0A1S3I4X8_LINAN|nr:cytochrome b-c1 complex subunit 2, mitochondrial [Lingula anatina]|eukprot:XP_013393325.1 cytochrome b-c1 complex subunit 2, mitochondrial [Lingula anatina]
MLSRRFTTAYNLAQTVSRDAFRVTSVKSNSAVSTVQLVLPSGARYEERDELGIGHFIRRAAELSNGQRTAFANARALGETGCSFLVTGTREHIIYSIDSFQNQDSIKNAYELLLAMTFQPLYNGWDLAAALTPMQLDLAILTHRKDIRVIELLHQAAYKDTLGQSVYAPAENFSKFGQQMALDFIQRTFNNFNLVCVNTERDLEEQLADMTSEFTDSGDKGTPPKKAVYRGGTLMNSVVGDHAYAAVAVEGASIGSKEALPLGVLQKILYREPAMKYTSPGGRLPSAIAKAVNDNFMCGNLNFNYSDSGLFGFSVVANAEDAGVVLEAAAAEMKSLCSKGASSEEVARAKASLKMDTIIKQENARSFATMVTDHAENNLPAPTLQGALEAIDKVTVEQVNETAKSLLKRKPTLAAVGNTITVPFVDDLF